MVTESRPILFVTSALPQAVFARAASQFDLRLWHGGPECTAQEPLATAASGCDALLCTPADRLDGATIAALPASLRVLATFSVGHEHIDLAACAARGLPVVNTPGVLSQATAEFTLMLLLAAARRAYAGSRMLREGRWGAWSPTGMLGTQVSGKRLGIFGMGRIGQTLARMARGLEMEIHYHNRRPLPPELALGAQYHATDTGFLGAIDMLALCAPGGPETKHWLNASRIAALRPGAVVVNTARGSLIEDASLIAALQSGHVSACGLDVFAAEPAVPEGYLGLENAVLMPHLGSATVETRNAMGMLALDAICAVLAGRVPGNLVRG